MRRGLVPHSSSEDYPDGIWRVKFNKKLLGPQLLVPRVTQVSISGMIRGPTMVDAYGFPKYRQGVNDFVLWREGNVGQWVDPNDTRGSRVPVAVDLAQTGSTIPRLRIDVPENFLGIPFQLTGEELGDANGMDIIRSYKSKTECFTTPGTHRIQVVVLPPWEHHNMPAVDPQSIYGPPSRLEFYTLNGSLPTFFEKNMVPVALARPFVLSYRHPTATWEQHCATVAFQDLSFKYDAEEGKPRYWRKVPLR
ncbi:hypothetical protein Dda_3888 [Drechslerella dactyloides]|uniref:Uncharacterized protein n=1 Tax=Drechslerella dactyloides TaxID=74499 RepID=A0AAD6NKB5_DREDA|nr:hypothetical protein Dda_3888 [Drechslerella dactyloides]